MVNTIHKFINVRKDCIHILFSLIKGHIHLQCIYHFMAAITCTRVETCLNVLKTCFQRLERV